jgi:hypothetical protein
MLANMKSKNELKANHNSFKAVPISAQVGKYEVKERIESKSQHKYRFSAWAQGWQI